MVDLLTFVPDQVSDTLLIETCITGKVSTDIGGIDEWQPHTLWYDQLKVHWRSGLASR